MVDENERPPSPEETLRLIERQRADTVRQLRGDPLLQYVPWGVAWAIGFTTYFLHYGFDGTPYAPITETQALVTLLGSQLVAGAVAAYGITKQSAQTRGDNSARGRMYGFTWLAGFLLMSVIAIRISPMLPSAETGLVWAGASLLLVGVLYMAGGAIWLDWQMFFIGAWVVAVDAAGVLLGPGWHALLTAVLLGGGFIAAGLWFRRRP
ncbi:hypothetical protein [Nonomuraea cavernae]|uniref:hypothetical protein n=1 Tax=Nonomuraea cavernae TaxID=2045107 RepID=UPI0033F2BCC3